MPLQNTLILTPSFLSLAISHRDGHRPGRCTVNRRCRNEGLKLTPDAGPATRDIILILANVCLAHGPPRTSWPVIVTSCTIRKLKENKIHRDPAVTRHWHSTRDHISCADRTLTLLLTSNGFADEQGHLWELGIRPPLSHGMSTRQQLALKSGKKRNGRGSISINHSRHSHCMPPKGRCDPCLSGSRETATTLHKGVGGRTRAAT